MDEANRLHDTAEPGPALTPEAAANLIRTTPELLLIDLRTDPEDLEEFSIPGATNVAISLLKSRIGALSPDRGAPIMICCDTGNYSKAAVLLLRELGYTRVTNGGNIVLLGEALGLTSGESS